MTPRETIPQSTWCRAFQAVQHFGRGEGLLMLLAAIGDLAYEFALSGADARRLHRLLLLLAADLEGIGPRCGVQRTTTGGVR